MALDILILVVIGAALVIGFIRGAISQLALIAGVVAGIAAARIFGDRIARFFADDGVPSAIEAAAGCAIAFIAAYLLAWVIVKIFRKTVHAVHLGIFDRIAGALVKAFVWALVLSIALNIYLMVKGNGAAIDSAGKPWRETIVRLAPATLGFIDRELNHLPVADGYNNERNSDKNSQ